MARGSDNPVIYLVGTSGNPNYGDEIITAAWLRYYADVLPEADVWLDCPRPGQAAVLFAASHPRLRCVDTLFHAAWNAPDASPGDIADFGRRAVREPGLIPREALGVSVVRQADVIHVIGGGYINRIWPAHYALLGAVAEAASMSGALTLITGAGLVPAVDGVEGLGDTLASFTVLDVRDEPSFRLLEGSVPTLSMTGDDAFLDLAGIPIARGPATPTVLCLQDDLQGVDSDTVVDYVVRTLEAWGVHRDPVLLLECLPPGDLFLTDRLRAHLPQLVTMPFAELWTQGFPVAQGQRWISTRFHPHLLAAAAGVWGVALPSVDYYSVKHASLAALGSGWTIATDWTTVVDPGELPGAPYGGGVPAMSRAKRELVDTALRGVL